MVPQERYESRWQLVEELQCSLAAISSGSSSSSDGAAPPPSMQPLRGSVELPPGRSTLTFLAAPVKRGLYKALGMQARLQHLPLHVAVCTPEPVFPAYSPAAGGGVAVAAAEPPMGSKLSSRAVLGGADEAQAASAAEAIIMQVGQAQPRVQLSLLAAGGSLIAGQEQWLGLALAPERDALHRAHLELSWPLSHPAAGGLAGAGAGCGGGQMGNYAGRVGYTAAARRLWARLTRSDPAPCMQACRPRCRARRPGWSLTTGLCSRTAARCGWRRWAADPPATPLCGRSTAPPPCWCPPARRAGRRRRIRACFQRRGRPVLPPPGCWTAACSSSWRCLSCRRARL